MGTQKASRINGSAQEKPLAVAKYDQTANNKFRWFGVDAFPGPHVGRRATQVLAEKARGLSEARRAEFRSARQYRVAQGTRVAGADPGVAFSLAGGLKSEVQHSLITESAEQ